MVWNPNFKITLKVIGFVKKNIIRVIYLYLYLIEKG